MAVQRTYPVVYGGWLGVLIAVAVAIVCLVLWVTNQLDPKLAALIGALAVARLV